MNLKNTDSVKEATKSYTLKDDVYTKCLEQANSQKQSRLVAPRGWMEAGVTGFSFVVMKIFWS